MQGHFVVIGHFVTICEVFVVPSLSYQVFCFHCFFTNSGKKTEKETKKDKKEKKDKTDAKDPAGTSTLAVETRQHLI